MYLRFLEPYVQFFFTFYQQTMNPRRRLCVASSAGETPNLYLILFLLDSFPSLPLVALVDVST